jgi:hypothetical protein
MQNKTYILSYQIPSESFDYEYEREHDTELDALTTALIIAEYSEGTHVLMEYDTVTNEEREIDCSEMWLLYDMMDLKELTGTQER